MSVFYNNYVAQCNKVGKSPSAVALEIGLSKTAVHGWKTKKSNPTDATIQKVADYFDVPVSTLVSDQKEKPVPDDGNRLKPDSYYKLTPENMDFIDSMIEKLLKSQSGD